MFNDMIQIKISCKEGFDIKIQTTRNEIFKNVMQKFQQKSDRDPNLYIFFNNAKPINENQIIAEINNTDNQFTITAIPKYNQTNENSLKKSKYIICPKCQKNCIINFDNYKISLEECDNNHKTSNIFFEEFEKTQNINQSKINCGECTKNRSNIIDNNFYKCFTCNKNLCPDCKERHINNHYMIDYDKINYFCNKHKNNHYEYYCKDCHKNLCSICKSNHKNHNIIYDFNIKDRNDDQKNKIVFNVFKNEINGIKNMFDVIINNFEIYFKIIKEIQDKYDNNNINYQIYQNMNNISKFNNDIIKEMKNIIFEKNINDKLYYLYKIYSKMIKKDNLKDLNLNNNNEQLYFEPNSKNDEIEIKYKNNKNNEIKLFGEEFIFNNKDKCVMKYKNNYYNLQNNYNKSLLGIDDEYFTIKLQLSEEITDLSYMFNNCSQLVELPDIYKLRTERVTNMSYLFNNCSSLSNCRGITKWTTSNVTNMSNMFYGCNSLSSLPDISNWETSNVKNMNFIFSNCKSLSSFPEINKWNTNNLKVSIMMFWGCNNKVLLPDISSWNFTKEKISNPLPSNNIQNNPTPFNNNFTDFGNKFYNQFNLSTFIPINNNINSNDINSKMNNNINNNNYHRQFTLPDFIPNNNYLNNDTKFDYLSNSMDNNKINNNIQFNNSNNHLDNNNYNIISKSVNMEILICIQDLYIQIQTTLN